MRSPISWMGSKRKLAGRILELLPPHTCYVEAFAGSGAVLFAREEPADVEVLNDTDLELVNLFRVVKHHLVEFCHQFRYAVVSRQLFEWLGDTPPDTLTDIQRAARFYYLQRLCFGGKAHGRTFGTTTTAPPHLNLVRVEEDLSAVHMRLARVVLERLHWENCVDRYDRPHTAFLLDPPYWQTAGYAGTALELGDYERIADRMRKLRGGAVLTINDHPDMRRIFAGFPRERVELTYSVGGGHRQRRAAELIIRSRPAR